MSHERGRGRRPASPRPPSRQSRLWGAVVAAMSLVTHTASAQDIFGGGGATSGPSMGRPDVTNAPESGKASNLSRRSVKLFDMKTSTFSNQIDVGPIWVRQVQDETPAMARRNFERRAPLAGEIAFGTIYTTPSVRGPFFLVGQLKTLLRIVDGKSFAWSLFHQEFGGGIRIGPFEPEIRLRLSLLTADIFRAEPSIQMFTPGVSAGFGVRIGTIRLDIKAHSEYFWRWFGPDYLIRGVTIGFRLDQTRPKSPFPGVPSSQ